MVKEGKGRLFRRKDGKCLIYIPKGVATDSMFPFKKYSQNVRIRFEVGGEERLIVEKWEEKE